jgi:site-specific recombinase XerD
LTDPDKKVINKFKQYLQDEQLSEDTIKTYTIVLKQYTREVKRSNPIDTTVDDVRAWRTYCTNRGFAKSSLINKYACIRKFVEYLVDEHDLLSGKEHNKIKKILVTPDVKSKIVKPLTEEQVERVFKIAKSRCKRDYAIFLVMYEGCLRRTELLNLKISDIDTDNRRVRVDGIKREDDRLINISKRCFDAIIDYINNEREEPLPQYQDYIFLNNSYKLSKNKLFTLNKEYKLRADLPEEFTLHGWRHTGITHLTLKALKTTKQNVPLTLKLLQSQSGHKDANVLLDKYVNIYKDDIKKFYNNVWDDKDEEPIPEEPKPQPEKKPEPKKPQDNYIANREPQQVIVSAEEYKRFLEFKKQQEISTAYY